MVTLERGVAVLVSEGIEQELGACPARGVGGVVIFDGLGVEEFADVVGVVAGFL